MHGTKMRLGHELRNIIHLSHLCAGVSLERQREGGREEGQKEGGREGRRELLSTFCCVGEGD